MTLRGSGTPDYIAVVQTARVWADGYDKKSEERLLAALAPEVSVDYTLIVPAWGIRQFKAAKFAALWLSEEHLGLKPLVTQHLLAQPYFKKVTADEIVVEWQQLASHGRLQDDGESARDASTARINETSDGKSHMQHQFVRVGGLWKIATITPSLLYQTGDFMRIRRPAGEQCNFLKLQTESGDWASTFQDTVSRRCPGNPAHGASVLFKVAYRECMYFFNYGSNYSWH
ncbi:scytalone dehydratase [Fusarium coicis]|nr:scytalone dehydratase [Fusarium coicis]